MMAAFSLNGRIQVVSLSKWTSWIVSVFLVNMPIQESFGQPYTGTVRDNSGGFDDDVLALSTPFLEPVNDCQNFIEVDGIVPGATVEVRVNGALIVTEIVNLNPSIIDVPLSAPGAPSAFALGDKVAVRQVLGSSISGEAARFAGQHATLTAAEIPHGLFECAKGVASTGGTPGAVASLILEAADGMGGYLPAEVTATAPVSHNGTALFPNEYISLYSFGARYSIQQDQCGSSSLSPTSDVLPEPSIGAPTIFGVSAYGGYSVVYVVDAIPGATVEILVDGQHGAFSRANRGGVVRENVSGAMTGSQVTARQWLCGAPGQGGLPYTVGVVGEAQSGCLQPPPPRIRPPQPGDMEIRLFDVRSGSRIRVFADGLEIGDGGGSRIQLSRSILEGDVVAVVETSACGENDEYFEYIVPCDPTDVVELVRTNDTEGRRFPVAWHFFESDDDYELTSWRSEKVRGTVWYPSLSPGADEDVRPGNYPLIVMMIGAVDCAISGPHNGFAAFAHALVANGYVVAALDVDSLNCDGHGQYADEFADDMAEREGYLASAVHFLREGQSSTRILDLQAVLTSELGLYGHSRGGDAVVRVAAGCVLDGCQLTAPVDVFGVMLNGAVDGGQLKWNTSTSMWDVRVGDMPDSPHLFGPSLFSLTGAADCDIASYEGLRHFDRATGSGSDWFKSSFVVMGARHNPWIPSVPAEAQCNSGHNDILSGFEHEHLHQVWGPAFFLAARGDRPDLMPIFTGGAIERTLPTETKVVDSYRTTAASTLDDFENGLAVNTLGLAVAESMGLSCSDLKLGLAQQPAMRYQSETTVDLCTWGNTSDYVSSVPSQLVDISDYIYARVGLGSTNQQPVTGTQVRFGILSNGIKYDRRVSRMGGIPARLPLSQTRTTLLSATVRSPVQCLRDSSGAPPTSGQVLDGLVFSFEGASGPGICIDDLAMEDR